MADRHETPACPHIFAHLRRTTTLFAFVVSALALPSLPDAAAAETHAAPGPAPVDLAARPDTTDPVGTFLTRLEAGTAELSYDSAFGYLPAVLEALAVPVSSQTLVFSRTSLQTDVIAPWTPRAIYFNDDVYVGYTVDGFAVEIAAVSRRGGSVFYTVDQRLPDTPDLRRDDLTCKSCHTTGVTAGVPGVMMRSFLTDRLGYPVVPVNGRPTDDRTPMGEKFAGWYVTGEHTLPHAGNVRAELLAHEIDQPDAYLEGFDLHTGGNVTSLGDFFDESMYLGTGSDIAALMVLAHQTRVHNLLTVAAETGGGALRYARRRPDASGDEPVRLPSAQERELDFVVDRLVQSMLFYRAAPIGEVRGASAFADEFEARGPFDSKGRSLRRLRLDDRLFEYPLSFLVYSEAFDGLPQLVRARVYDRMIEILTGDDDPDYPALRGDTKAAVLEILRETKPEFDAAFTRATG